MQSSWVFVVGIVIATAAPAAPLLAQRASKDSAHKTARIPADSRPPKGMCRIWIEGVPAAQQPAATDCATAVKNRPANGRVLFGDDNPDSTKKSDDKPKLPPTARGFTGVKKPPVILPKRPPG